MVKTKVETVQGPIDPDNLKRTLTHEHTSMNYEKCLIPPRSKADEANVECSFKLENYNWIKHNPYTCVKNMRLEDHTDVVIEELKLFHDAGGSTIVDNTSYGLNRDVLKMKSISEAANINIICGTGYYIECQLTEAMKALTIEKMTENILSDINDGIDNTSIKAGVIGEVGCSWPLTAVERRSIQAAAISQAQSHTPVIIHPGRNPVAPDEIMRIFCEAGGNARHTVMAHLDRTLLEDEDLLEFAKMGTYLEYDLFGIECSYYSHDLKIDMPSDAERINKISTLIRQGYGERVLVAHDIHVCSHLTKYGGHGYAHFLKHVMPKMLIKGVSQQSIDRILIENPKSLLTYCK